MAVQDWTYTYTTTPNPMKDGTPSLTFAVTFTITNGQTQQTFQYTEPYCSDASTFDRLVFNKVTQIELAARAAQTGAGDLSAFAPAEPVAPTSLQVYQQAKAANDQAQAFIDAGLVQPDDAGVAALAAALQAATDAAKADAAKALADAAQAIPVSAQADPSDQVTTP